MSERQDALAAYLGRSVDALQRAAADPAFVAATRAIAAALSKALRAGGKILIAGNGGSAADAQHISAELLSLSRFASERRPPPAVALTDPAVLTAIGNDYGYERVFERQVGGLGRPGDMLLAISTSGRSVNVLTALVAARKAGLVTVGFTGTQGLAMRELCDLCLVAPSDETAVIQQVYMTAAHAICAVIEHDLAEPGGA
jgi:D-sedoheptulose 7-phosphate isomerase